MHKQYRGFTIVELLIVIVVIAILAAITIVAFNGVQSRANNSSRATELAAWKKSFELYKAQNGSYPVMTDGGYCLGKNFPIGYGGTAACRDFAAAPNSNIQGAGSYQQSAADSLNTMILTVSTLPTGTRVPVNGTIGPYAIYQANEIKMSGIFTGASASDCPANTIFNYSDGSLLICSYSLTRT